MPYYVTIEGGEEVARRLAALPARMEKEILRRGTAKAAVPIFQRARHLVPLRTGALASSLVIAPGGKRGRSVGVTVGTKKGWYRGETFYGAFVELGHHIGKRKSWHGEMRGKRKVLVAAGGRRWMPGVEFLRHALDESETQAIDILSREIRAGIVMAMEGLAKVYTAGAKVPTTFAGLRRALGNI